jgi:hypothetical protein
VETTVQGGLRLLDDKPIAKVKRSLTMFLGGLWLVDGLLQLQPAMFTEAFPNQVVLPALQSLPPPLGGVAVDTLYPLITGWEHLFNAMLIAVQLTLGALLVAGTLRGQPSRIVLTCSAAWAAAIWVFGQAFGPLFTQAPGGKLVWGSPSLYSGFPGSALLYLIVSVVLLEPHSTWASAAKKRFSFIWDAGLLVLAVAAALQVNPTLFTPSGQNNIFQANIMSYVPGDLAWSIRPVALAAAAHPLVAATVEAVAIVGVASLLKSGWTRVALVALAGLLGFVWWFGLGLGGVLTGLGTDPNTPPLLFALCYLSIIRRRWNSKEQPRREP